MNPVFVLGESVH